jgi:signal transduction histidine kinase
MRVFLQLYTGQNYSQPRLCDAPILSDGRMGVRRASELRCPGTVWEGSAGKVERVQRGCVSIPEGNLADGSAVTDVSSIAVGSSLRDLCHDLMEPTATINWLVRAADTESGQDLRNRLEAIAIAASQIAAICERILDRPQQCAPIRLDLLADDAVACSRVRYAGVIDVASQPVTALARPGDVIRILCNLLTNACRAAGSGGRVRVLVDDADGLARLSVADSGNGLGRRGTGGRAGLGLDIIGALTLNCSGSVEFSVSDLGGLAVTVLLPAPGRSRV